MTSTPTTEPTDFIVTMGNAFFLQEGTVIVMAAPQLANGEIEWSEAVEVERQDLEDTAVVDAIFLTLHTIGSK